MKKMSTAGPFLGAGVASCSSEIIPVRYGQWQYKSSNKDWIFKVKFSYGILKAEIHSNTLIKGSSCHQS